MLRVMTVFLNMKIETVIYSVSVLLFGGIGLLAAFLLELRMEREERKITVPQSK